MKQSHRGQATAGPGVVWGAESGYTQRGRVKRKGGLQVKKV
jgi:hypothetical protein